MVGKKSAGMCIVPDCLSAYYPGCGIRFHVFPPDRKKRDHWLESLNLTPKDYQNGAKVCYRHFKTSDYLHNNPRQALKKNAVPALKVEPDSDAESLDIDTALEKLNEVTSSESDGGGDVDDYISAEELSIPSSDDEPKKTTKKRKKTATKTAVKKNQDAKVKKEVKKNAKGSKAVKISEEDLNTHLGLQVCRICLVTGCKMFSMSHYNLENTYLLLTGITAEMFDSSKMPQMLCYECLQRLLNFIEFSTKSLTSWTCLMELIEGDILTMDTIKNINRKQHLLETKLALTVFEPNHFDLQVEEYEEEIGDQKLEDVDKEMLEDTIDKEIDETIDKEIDETIDKEILYLEDGTIVETEYQDGETKDKSASEDDDDFAKHESDFGLQNSDDENDIDKNYDYSVRKTNIVTQYAKEFNEMFEVIKMTEEDARDEINKRKFTDHYHNAAFKCEQCFRAFQLEGPYWQHMRLHSKDYGPYKCDICKMHFETFNSLKKHKMSKHARFMKCRLCPFTTTFSSAAAAHKHFHEGRRYQCEHCPKHFTSVATFINHRQRWHPEDVVCHLCGESFPGIRRLQTHFKFHHKAEELMRWPPEDVVCHLCGASFPGIRRLQTHFRFHHKAEELMIKMKKRKSKTKNIRSMATRTKYTHVSYLTTLPEDSPYCATCDMRFLTTEALRKHVSVSPCHGHPAEEPFKPGKRARLDENDAESTKKKSVTCEQCGEVLESIRRYISHFLDKHPGKNRTQFSQGPNQYMCEVCGRVMQNVTTLREHLHSHTGARPFACEKCGRTFATKQALSAHMPDHTQSRRCRICGRELASRAGLQRHVAIHLNAKPYSCEPCNKRFCNPSAKRAHIRHFHMGVPWPKKRPRDQPASRQRGGTFRSDVDIEMDELNTEE